MCREGMTGAENVDAFDKVLQELLGLLFACHAVAAMSSSSTTART